MIWHTLCLSLSTRGSVVNSKLRCLKIKQIGLLLLFLFMYLFYCTGDHPRQDSMDFSNEWGDPSNCRCGDRLKPLERRAARQHQRCLAHSLVGTPNYIAPEVLLRTGRTFVL